MPPPHLILSNPLRTDDQHPDATIIATVLAGDVESFRQLVEKYQDRLFNMLYRITGSREEAEDVAQEAFVKAFTKLASFRGDSSFYTWLYRIAMNISIGRYRKQRPTTSIDPHDSLAAGEFVDPSNPPEHATMQRETVESVHRALAKLSIDYRQILILREIEGCSYEAISQILELPIGTVRSRIHRARVQLADVLTELPIVEE